MKALRRLHKSQSSVGHHRSSPPTTKIESLRLYRLMLVYVTVQKQSPLRNQSAQNLGLNHRRYRHQKEHNQRHNDNGFHASLIAGTNAYGEPGQYECAILDEDGHIVDDEGILHEWADPYGNLSIKELEELLVKISKLIKQ